MIKLGSWARDKVTGFAGAVIGRAEFLFGEPSVLIQPQAGDNHCRWNESRWVEEGRVEALDRKDWQTSWSPLEPT